MPAIPTLFTTDREQIIAHLRAADPKLAALIDRVGHSDVRLMHGHSIYESLLRSIVYQQLAGAAAAAIFLRVQKLYVPNDDAAADANALTGGNIRIPRKTKALPYPSAEQIASSSEELLRSAGLSRAKMLAIKDLAAKSLDGTVPSMQKARFMSDEELIERLTTIRGIGRWTVEMMLMFRLGRLDVLPVSDYGVRKGFQLIYRMRALPKPDRMHTIARKWAPYRSIGSWYMWRALEQSKK